MANTKVTGDVIANGTISTVHLADDAITAAKLDSTATGITFADLTVDTDTLYVDAANNRVGIGTTLPTQALHVVGNIYSVSSGTDGGEIRLANSGGGSNWYWAARTTGLNLGELGAADGRIFIANGGDVGIGTTSPNAKTNIEDGHLLVSQSVNTTQENILLQGAGYHIGSTLYGNVSIRSNYNNSTNSGTLNFYTAASGTNTAERMRIDSSGNVDINAGVLNIGASRSTYIDASEDSTATGHIFVSNDAVGDFSQLAGNLIIQARIHPTVYRDIIFAGGLNTAEALMTIQGEGNVGIGTDSPERKLHVFKGESGGATSNSDSSLVLENSSNTYLQFLTPTTVESGILFGDTDNDVGAFTYSHNTNSFNFRTAGVSNRMVIDSSGNVGIGTTSPIQKLHLNNSATLTATYQKFTNGTATTGTTLGIDADGDFLINNGEAKEIKLYTNDTQRLTIQSGGNVGIGTGSPSATLHVATAGGIKLFNDGVYGYISIGSSGLTGQYPYLRVDSFRSDGSGYFWALGHERADGTKSIKMLMNDGTSDQVTIINSLAISRFTANEFNSSYPSFSTGALIRSNDTSYFNGGNVGIGTTSPSEMLHLASTGSVRIKLEADTNNITETDNPQILFSQDGGAVNASIGFESAGGGTDNNFFIWNTYNSPMRFATNNSERMRINSGGYLKVSNTSSYISATGTYHEVRTNKNNSYISIFDNAATSNSGFAGINIRYSALSPDANTNSFLICEDSTAIRMRIYSDGDVWTSDAGTLTSDETLKNTITDATPKLNDVMQLQVRNFYWNEDFHLNKTDKKNIGFIAQEFEQVFPSLVSEHIIKDEELDENGTVIQEAVYKKGIKEGKLIPILVKAIQEQQEIINDLKNRIQILENN